MQQTDITQFTTLQLKALGFDLTKELSILQNNLKVLNEELAKRPPESPIVNKLEDTTPENIASEAPQSPQSEVNG